MYSGRIPIGKNNSYRIANISLEWLIFQESLTQLFPLHSGILKFCFCQFRASKEKNPSKLLFIRVRHLEFFCMLAWFSAHLNALRTFANWTFFEKKCQLY